MRIRPAVVVLAVLFLCSSVSAQMNGPFYKRELGALFSYTRLDFGGPKVHQLGLGARFSYNFNANFALDTEYDWSHDDRDFNFSPSGGHIHALVAGLKVGARWERFGLFAKVRPGLVTSTHVVKAIDFTATSSTTTFGSRTDPALDFGGVFEFYPQAGSRRSRWLWRTDIGVTEVFYGDGFRIIAPTFTGNTAGDTKIHFHIKTGLSWRF